MCCGLCDSAAAAAAAYASCQKRRLRLTEGNCNAAKELCLFWDVRKSITDRAFYSACVSEKCVTPFSIQTATIGLWRFPPCCPSTYEVQKEQRE